MRVPDVQEINKVCEGCNQNIPNRIVSGVEADAFGCSPVCLCESCGQIDLGLMQYCREIVLGCNGN
jgi:hypothetical protein